MSLLRRVVSGRSGHCLNADAPVGEPLEASKLADLASNLLQAEPGTPLPRVDYAAASTRLDTARRALHTGLRAFEPRTLETREQALAFWINLYNVLVVDAVVAFGVRRTVVGSASGLFRFFEKAAYLVGGMRFSANDIENGVLRSNSPHMLGGPPPFPAEDERLVCVVQPPEPRIHFALTCASRSCPPIRVYVPAGMERQLDIATRAFVDGETRTQDSPPSVTLSRIFKWYEDDFRETGGALPFVRVHLPEGDARRALLEKHGGRIEVRYDSYDWRLNRLRSAG